jgi:hypothetical protein
LSKSRKKRKSPKRVLALPDLEQAKSAVINSLTSRFRDCVACSQDSCDTKTAAPGLALLPRRLKQFRDDSLHRLKSLSRDKGVSNAAGNDVELSVRIQIGPKGAPP